MLTYFPGGRYPCVRFPQGGKRRPSMPLSSLRRTHVLSRLGTSVRSDPRHRPCRQNLVGAAIYDLLRFALSRIIILYVPETFRFVSSTLCTGQEMRREASGRLIASMSIDQQGQPSEPTQQSDEDDVASSDGILYQSSSDRWAGNTGERIARQVRRFVATLFSA